MFLLPTKRNKNHPWALAWPPLIHKLCSRVVPIVQALIVQRQTSLEFTKPFFVNSHSIASHFPLHLPKAPTQTHRSGWQTPTALSGAIPNQSLSAGVLGHINPASPLVLILPLPWQRWWYSSSPLQTLSHCREWIHWAPVPTTVAIAGYHHWHDWYDVIIIIIYQTGVISAQAHSRHIISVSASR